MDKEQFIYESLGLPLSAISYHTSLHLATRFPNHSLLEGEEGLFNIEEFAKAGRCDLKHKAIVHNQVTTQWHAPDMTTQFLRSAWRVAGQMPEKAIPGQTEAEQQVFDRSKNAWLEVAWDGSIFDVIVMNWLSDFRPYYHFWILTESMERARALFVEVCKWNAEVRGELLVFDGGCWHKDAQLFQAIKGSTFDNLVLRGSLKQDLREDFEQFFTARSTYETYNIPWKRGVLFVGPPGNGKTHAVKAIINTMNQSCLYVKSFRAEPRP